HALRRQTRLAEFQGTHGGLRRFGDLGERRHFANAGDTAQRADATKYVDRAFAIVRSGREELESRRDVVGLRGEKRRAGGAGRSGARQGGGYRGKVLTELPNTPHRPLVLGWRPGARRANQDLEIVDGRREDALDGGVPRDRALSQRTAHGFDR